MNPNGKKYIRYHFMKEREGDNEIELNLAQRPDQIQTKIYK